MLVRFLGVLILSAGLINTAEARRDRRPQLRIPGQPNALSLAQAVQNRRRAHFVQGVDLVVTRLLPDDNQGLKHQKFMVRIGNGIQVMIVSNLELCKRVPVRVGDVVSAAGEFIWTKNGGLLHWVHSDPRGLRPNGFIQHAGQTYCQ